MEAPRYRLVLTGEIVQGHDPEKVVTTLAGLFRQPPDTIRKFLGRRPFPINQEFEYEKATRARDRIVAAGAGCTVEAIDPPASAAPASAPAAPLAKPAAPGFTCPKCGHAQSPGETCVRCGVIFAKVRAREAAQASQETPPPEVDRDTLVEYFIGPNADRYLPRFERFRERRGFALTWHWPAFLVPFFWALYRRLWLWAAVMLFTGFLWPFVNVLWGVTGHYLYFRHTEAEVDRAVRRRRSAEEVEAAGGVSPKAVWAAIVALVVVSVLWMVLIASLFGKAQETVEELQQQQAAMPAAAMETPEGSATYGTMVGLSFAITVANMGGDSLAGKSIDDLKTEYGFDERQITDAWGNRMRVRIGESDFTITSAGPDGTLDSGDDMKLDRPL